MLVLTPNKGSSPGLKAKDPVIDAETINQNNTARENAVNETGVYLVWFQPGQFHPGTFVSVLSGVRVLLGVALRRRWLPRRRLERWLRRLHRIPTAGELRGEVPGPSAFLFLR